MGHSGSIGNPGFSRPAGATSYSGMIGPQRPSSFSPPGRFPLPARLEPPARNGIRPPYRGSGFSGYRPDYTNRGPYRGPYHDHHGEHRHPYYRYGYALGYPGYGYGYYPYPYVIDPGFYDWGAPNDSENQQGAGTESASQPVGYYPDALNPGYDSAPYPQQENTQPPPGATHAQVQEYHFADSTTASSQTSRPLKVIFRDNRAPLMVQNYMISSSSLTDLDQDEYQKIPLDQIDIPGTQKANRVHGIFFDIPSGTSD